MTLCIGDLVEFWPAWINDRSVPSWGRGRVRYLHHHGNPTYITITLDEDTRRRRYAGIPPSRRRRTLTLLRSDVRRIGPFRPGDPPTRYGPYVPIAKALP